MRPILYGVSDFAELRRSNGWYIDRTARIRDLESTRFAMFLRPRRFGKSLLISTLQAYYDINYEQRFEQLFSGTDIGSNPTPEHNKYLILYFNFSAVDKAISRVEASFDAYASTLIDAFTHTYEHILPERTVNSIQNAEGCVAKMNTLFAELKGTKHDVYVLIDEYDNFTNTILSEHGEKAYNDLCHGDGFFKQFFNVLKATSTSADAPVKRIFITGVSPVTMDDVTSGFNIAMNISLQSTFADWLGFTHEDLRQMAEYYAPYTGQTAEQICKIAMEWYDNYRFSVGNVPSMANTTLILSFVKHLLDEHRLPSNMLDANLRTDYVKIRHLVTIGNRLNGNFHKFEEILNAKQIEGVELKDSFQATAITKPDNFLSLLFYFGILTIAGEDMGTITLAIPNRLISAMAADFIPAAYEDIFKLDPRVDAILKGMLQFNKNGTIEGFLSPVCDFVKQIFAVRDAKEGEIAVQSAVLALLTCARGPYIVMHEREANGGYYDIGLAPQLSLWPEMANAAIIELKYIKAGEAAPTPEKLEAMRQEASAQLDCYAKDQNLAQEWRLKPGNGTPGIEGGTVTLHRIVLAFHGGNCVLCEKLP